MTPERRAHNTLHLPLWVEWEAFCLKVPAVKYFSTVAQGDAVDIWVGHVQRHYGGTVEIHWVGNADSDFQVGEDIYERYDP